MFSDYDRAEDHGHKRSIYIDLNKSLLTSARENRSRSRNLKAVSWICIWIDIIRNCCFCFVKYLLLLNIYIYIYKQIRLILLA